MPSSRSRARSEAVYQLPSASARSAARRILFSSKRKVSIELADPILADHGDGTQRRMTRRGGRCPRGEPQRQPPGQLLLYVEFTGDRVAEFLLLSFKEKQIARIRERLGLSQRQAGALPGGGPGSFQKYERGKDWVTGAMANSLRLLERGPSGVEALRVMRRGAVSSRRRRGAGRSTAPLRQASGEAQSGATPAGTQDRGAAS